MAQIKDSFSCVVSACVAWGGVIAPSNKGRLWLVFEGWQGLASGGGRPGDWSLSPNIQLVPLCFRHVCLCRCAPPHLRIASPKVCALAAHHKKIPLHAKQACKWNFWGTMPLLVKCQRKLATNIKALRDPCLGHINVA